MRVRLPDELLRAEELETEDELVVDEELKAVQLRTLLHAALVPGTTPAFAHHVAQTALLYWTFAPVLVS